MHLSARSPARQALSAGFTPREDEALRHIARLAQAGIELVPLLDHTNIEKARVVMPDTAPKYIR